MRLTYLIVESLSHSDGTPWEVRIVILTLPQLYTRWRVTVPGQQCKDVVLKQTKSVNNRTTQCINSEHGSHLRHALLTLPCLVSHLCRLS